MTLEIFIRFTYYFLSNLLAVLEFVIFLVIILSWFPIQKNKFTTFLNDIAAPILKAARKITPKTGMLDLSPIVVFIAIYILQQLLFYVFNLIVS